MTSSNAGPEALMTHELDKKGLDAARKAMNDAATKRARMWQNEEKISDMPDPVSEAVLAYLSSASILHQQEERIAELTRERDAAKLHAKSSAYRIRSQREQLRRLQPRNRLVRPSWLANYRIGLHVNELHRLWRDEADALSASQARVKVLKEALEPFGKYLDEVPVDLDNKGQPVPDKDGVGWVYLTVGDFRRARTALQQTKEKGNG